MYLTNNTNIEDFIRVGFPYGHKNRNIKSVTKKSISYAVKTQINTSTQLPMKLTTPHTLLCNKTTTDMQNHLYILRI
jgi:hypothetical protein